MCAAVGGVRSRGDVDLGRKIIEYSQHTNVEKLDYFGGLYVVVC